MSTALDTRAPAAAPPPAQGSPMTGVGTLIRFILRRDRVRLPIWIAAISAFTVLFANSLPEIYADAADRQVRASIMANPGTAAMSGPGFGLDDYTFGAMLSNEFISWTAIFFALMSVLLMVRHTRTEEEAGRAELVRAGVVGRHANTAAALIVVGGASVVTGMLMALGLGALGLETVTWEGSWLFGLSLASVGIVFAAAAAVAAQVSQNGRGAGGFAGATLGAVYLLRAAGDMSAVGGGDPDRFTVSWLSPIGWAQQTRPYVSERWWPLLLSLVLTIVLVAVAAWLSIRRDLGSGLVQPRRGAPEGSRLLSSALGLSWRLHRTSVMWWSIALLVFGLGYGSLTAEVDRFVDELSGLQDWLATIGGDSLLDAFLAIVVSLMAIVVAVFAVLATLRLRSDEARLRAEPLLATGVSRTSLVTSQLAIAMGGSALLLGLGGLGLGITASAALDDAGRLPELVLAALAHVPAVWLTVAVGVALFGLLPRATPLIWVVIIYAGTIANLAALLDFPDWTYNLSPFGHVPLLPAEDFRALPVVVLILLTAGLLTAGLIGFRRRDLQSPA